MNQFELTKIAKEISKMYFEPYCLRNPRLPSPKKYSGGYDAWYSYLINEWIVNQPDKDNLMKLFILVGFDPVPFLQIIIGSGPGTKKNKKAA